MIIKCQITSRQVMFPLQGTLHVPELVIFLFAELGVTSYICNALRNNITYVVTK